MYDHARGVLEAANIYLDAVDHFDSKAQSILKRSLRPEEIVIGAVAASLWLVECLFQPDSRSRAHSGCAYHCVDVLRDISEGKDPNLQHVRDAVAKSHGVHWPSELRLATERPKKDHPYWAPWRSSFARGALTAARFYGSISVNDGRYFQMGGTMVEAFGWPATAHGLLMHLDVMQKSLSEFGASFNCRVYAGLSANHIPIMPFDPTDRSLAARLQAAYRE